MKIVYGAYVRFRGRLAGESVFTVVGTSTDGKHILCANCFGGKFWHPRAGLRMAY